jgi:hypothetical protein
MCSTGVVVVGGGDEESFGVAMTKFGCSLGDYGLLAWRLEREKLRENGEDNG